MPRTSYGRLNCSPGCAVEATLQRIDGKWKGVILWHLGKETLRFNALRRCLPNVTQRMLTNQLRELEADGLVIRHVYAEVPPKVEYSLSPLGRTLGPVVAALKAWGDAHGGLDEPTAPAENRDAAREDGEIPGKVSGETSGRPARRGQLVEAGGRVAQ